MADMFPPGSVIRRVNIEPAIMFGAGRALLLQIAHPSVAQGVHDHSDFASNPFKRLQGTLEATYAVVFGPEDLAVGVGQRIHGIHDHVTGPGYRANDPDLLLWVHATLADTALRCYTTLVGPLSAADAEAYYQEMKRVAQVFGLDPGAQPDSLADFRGWFDQTVATLEVTDTGRQLAADILDPVLPLNLHRPLRPLLRLHRVVTIGQIPDPLRSQFGLQLDRDEQRAFDRTLHLARGAFRMLPAPVRAAGPQAMGVYLLWLARRHVEQSRARSGALGVLPG